MVSIQFKSVYWHITFRFENLTFQILHISNNFFLPIQVFPAIKRKSFRGLFLVSHVLSAYHIHSLTWLEKQVSCSFLGSPLLSLFSPFFFLGWCSVHPCDVHQDRLYHFVGLPPKTNDCSCRRPRSEIWASDVSSQIVLFLCEAHWWF